jgi:hypothetical protein
LQLLNSSIYISPEHAYVEGSWLDASTRLDIIKTQGGIGLEGKTGISLFGFNALAHIKLDTASLSLQIDGKISDVCLAPVFRITGLKENEGAAFIMAFSNMMPVLDIQGKVELLGASAETHINASMNGFSFCMRDRLFGMYDCQLEAEGKIITDPGSFNVKGTFVQGEKSFYAYIQDSAALIIDSMMNTANTEIENINAELTKRQKELKNIDNVINSRRTELLRQRERDLADLESLKCTVTGFQNEINKIEATIKKQAVVAASRSSNPVWDTYCGTGGYRCANCSNESIPGSCRNIAGRSKNCLECSPIGNFYCTGRIRP